MPREGRNRRVSSLKAFASVNELLEGSLLSGCLPLQNGGVSGRWICALVS